MKYRRMQCSQFWDVPMGFVGWNFEIRFRPRQIHHHLEVKLCVISQSCQRIRRWMFGSGNCHLASFQSRQVFGCSIDHTDEIAILSPFYSCNKCRSGFGAGFNTGDFWKQAPDDVSGSGEFPVLVHANKVSLERVLPLGKRCSASLRSALTCFAVSGPSSGA